MRLKQANISLMSAILFLLCAGIACALPDLIVKSITVPSGISPSETFSIDFVIRNNGPSSITSGFYTRMYIDENLQSNQWAATSLAAGAEKLFIKASVSLAAGTHTVRVVTDFNSQVNEVSESNNEKTVSFSIMAPPSNNYDLIVKELTFPSGMCDGEQFNIDYVVKNLGPDAITGSFSTKMYIDGSDVTGNVPRTGIAAGAERAFTKYSVSLSQGSHTIRVVTDSLYEIVETNENNNEMSKSLTVCAPPKPCDGITCGDKCVGTTLYYNGYCSSGNCYWSQSPMSTSCGYDPCASKQCTPYCVNTTRFVSAGCSADNCNFVPTPNSPECGYVVPVNITCDNYCSGTTWYHDGVVSGGTCTYQSELNSVQCGYVEPVNITCTNHCSGTTWYHDGVVSGDTCNYQAESNSARCGYVDPCAGKTCDSYCSNTSHYTNGQCVNGVCSYTVNLLSPDCGYIPPIPSGHIVVLDPGHTNSSTEGALNHILSAKLKQLLEADGYVVYETPSDLNTSARANFADDLAADILLSIHFNADNTTLIEGSEAFYYDSDDLALCEKVLPYIVNILPSNNRRVKPDTASNPGQLGVLRSRNGTACLVEMEFLDRARSVTFMGTTYSNFSDLLHSDDYISASSEALKDAIVDYFGDAPVVNPCDGVVCADKCVGTTRNYAGHCSQGVCQYSIEPLSTSCGYDPCAFMPCSDYCNSTTKYSSGSCSAGKCSYATVQQKSPACGWANNTNILADIKISQAYSSPRTIACNASRSINAILELANQNSNFASNIGVQYSSPELGIGFSALEFNMFGNSVWTKSEPFAIPMNVKTGTYSINISVMYAGTRQNTEAYITLQPCADYFIYNIDSIPDIYQRNQTIGLPSGGWYQCGPASATNVLVWLYMNGFTNLSSGSEAEALNSTVHILSSIDYTYADKPRGVSSQNLITSLSKYVAERGYIMSNIIYQGSETEVLDKYDTNITQPQLDWIKSGIRGDTGVLLHYGWYIYHAVNGTYTRPSGHWVTAVGYGKDKHGNFDPNFIITHDPITDNQKNEYINMTLLNSGIFTGKYRMDGAYLLFGNSIVILEDAIRFNITKPVNKGAVTITQTTQTIVSSGSSGGGSGGSHSSAISKTTRSVSPAVTAQVVAAVNPAIASIKPRTSQTRKVQNAAAVTSAVTPVVNSTASPKKSLVNNTQPSIKKVPLATIGTDCSKDNACGPGEACMPKGVIDRLFTTPKCCPANNKLVDGKCIPPKTAGWNEPCSGVISCRTGLKCISTASWYSILNRDSGVCCYADEKQKDGHYLSKMLRSRPISV